MIGGWSRSPIMLTTNAKRTGTGGAGVRAIPRTPPIESYLCGGEERDYGNLIELSQLQFVLQGVQK